MTCQESHRYDPFFDQLREDQSEPARHRCAGCAYELGYSYGLEGRKRYFNPALVSISQAGYVRHRAAEDAFDMGYDQGEAERLQQEQQD